MNTKIKVVDSVMGSGKSTAAINYINDAGDNEKFLFVTPYLDEVDRIIQSCPNKHFCQPDTEEYATKTRDIIDLLKEGKNIVTTHALFSFFNRTISELIERQGYILIIDEVMNTINDVNISTSDFEVLTEKFIYFDEQGIAHWKVPDYDGILSGYKNMCDCGSLFKLNNTLFEIIPASIFKSFKDIFILTYMFEGQNMGAYLQLWGFEYEYYHVEDFSFVKGYKEQNGEQFKDKIHICDSSRMNIIGKNRKYDEAINDTTLSKGWYEKNKNKDVMKVLKNNIRNFFVNIYKVPVAETLWTTFKDFKEKIKGKGYTKGFLSLNIKATNEYKYKHYIAYVVNRYLNPTIKINFGMVGLYIDEEQFALSEMIQFIWRSAIRDGEDIYLYIPSRRMRYILQKWLGYSEKEMF